jgi:hypothetical protein
VVSARWRFNISDSDSPWCEMVQRIMVPRANLASVAAYNLQVKAGLSRKRIRIPPSPPGFPMVRGGRQSWWGQRWPTLEQLPGPIPSRHAGRPSQQHTCRSQERTSNSIAAIKQTIPATQDQVLREACVLTTLSLVAVLATLLAKSLYSIP